MRSKPVLLALAASILAAACASEAPAPGPGSGDGSSSPTGGSGDPGNPTDPFSDPDKPPAHTALDDRVVDYNEALRTASLKLVRALPTIDQMDRVKDATDKQAAYEEELDAMFADVRFQERMIKWWRDTMRQGGGAQNGKPSRDTAPTFAARLMVEERPYSEMFTASSNNCPTYDNNAHAFVDGECNNGAPAQAGVLTNPGVMYQFYGNMAFRRVRWIQEIFVCTKYPAEYAAEPVDMGGVDYVSPWPFDSVATAPINFQDTSSVVCANCHTTMNHLAPLFGSFDANGAYTNAIQVKTPVVPEVTTEISHWLKPGETTHWRHGQPVANLSDLGAAMAADPDVAECAVARMWNFAMSKEDIVTDLSTVPTEVIQPYIDEFNASGMNLKQVLRAMFASEDFIKF